MISLRLPANKDASLETLRGIAIILMVAGHVVGSEPEFAMQVADESPWRFVFWGFQDIRMPLFTVISGWLYAGRPLTGWNAAPRLVKAKTRRFLIPLAVVGTLLFWTKLVTPGTNSKPAFHDFWRPYLVGMDHLWFLQAIFLIFLAIIVVEMLGWLSTRGRWAATTLAFAAVFVVIPEASIVDVFSLSGAVRLLPFFLLGLGLRRFGLGARPSTGGALGAFSAFSLAYALRITEVYDAWDAAAVEANALALAVGALAVLLLFWCRGQLTWTPLAWIGQFAFPIYLLHYFAYSAARIGLRAAGFDLNLVTFIAGMIFGLGLPIAFYLLSARTPVVRLLFFGEKIPYRTSVTA